MAKILLTGFEPWGEWPLNPSGAVARALHGAAIGGYEVVSAVLPVVHGEDVAIVVPLIAEHRPRAVVSLGLHGGASVLHVERVAINLKVIDEADAPVAPGGPDAFFSTLPTRAMVQAMRQAGVPAKLTYSAGTFLCNHVMYSVLHHVAVHAPDIRAGFVHVPPTPDLMAERGGAQASMALADIQRGVTAGLLAVADFLNGLPVCAV